MQEDVADLKGKYLGHMHHSDPMYGFLTYDILSRLGVYQPRPDYRVFQLSGSNEVYACEERHSRTRVICKFFSKTCGGDQNRADAIASREYGSLETLRGYGLVGCPHHVVRPIGINRDINCVLVLEYYEGEQLSQAIHSAIHEGRREHLFWRLKALGYFLATQHNRTANGVGVNFQPDCDYADGLARRLVRRGRLHHDEVNEFRWLRDRWREKACMWQDQEVLLHGDATPANFIFGGGLDVGAIDLERMRRGDRVFDVGRIAGELQHAFLHATGDTLKAEPFIGHFLWEYCCHFPDRHRAFDSVTARVPFYMGINLLRIARNDWVSRSYARTLVEQAKVLLRSF